MLRLCLAVALWVVAASEARADRIVAASTTSAPGVLLSLESMLGDDCVAVERPESTELEQLYSWVVEHHGDFGLLYDTGTRRVYAIFPAERRLFERVVPEAADDYVIALAAFELAELAVHGEVGPTGVGGDAASATDDGAEEADSRGDEVEADAAAGGPRPPPPGPGPSAYLGGAAWVGLPARVHSVDLTIGASYTVRSRGRWRPWLDGSVHFLGRDSLHLRAPPDLFTLRYARRGLRLRVGLDHVIGRLSILPAVALGLDWVRAEVTRSSGSREFETTRDDRAEATVGLSVDARVRVATRGVLGVGAGLETVLGRTSYVVNGTTVLREPAVLATFRLIGGVNLPR